MQQRFRSTIFCQTRASQATIQFAAVLNKFLNPNKPWAGTGFLGMRTVFMNHICKVVGYSTDTRHNTFQGFQIFFHITHFAGIAVPGWMPVITVNQIGAKAANLTGCPRSLHMTEIAEEIDRTFQSFRYGRIFSAFFFQLQYIENLLPRG